MLPPKEALKVVAFDCDGVMFDSQEANRAYYNAVLAHLGLPAMSGDQLAYVHMHTVGESMAYLVGDLQLLDAAHAYRRQIGYLPFLGHMRMEPDLVELLQRLRPRFQTAVATNRTDTMAHVLRNNGIEHLFDLVVCALDVVHPKPHPECLQRVAAHFGVRPSEMIYVGDSLVDEQAARAAGVPLVAYRNRQLAADGHVERLAQIVDLLEL